MELLFIGLTLGCLAFLVKIIMRLHAGSTRVD